LACPSTRIRNLSLSRKRSTPTFEIPFTIESKLFVTCFAIATLLIPNKVVIADDVKTVAHDVLRHRIIPTFEAEAENITSDNIIDTLLDTIQTP